MLKGLAPVIETFIIRDNSVFFNIVQVRCAAQWSVACMMKLLINWLLVRVVSGSGRPRSDYL